MVQYNLKLRAVPIADHLEGIIRFDCKLSPRSINGICLPFETDSNLNSVRLTDSSFFYGNLDQLKQHYLRTLDDWIRTFVADNHNYSIPLSNMNLNSTQLRLIETISADINSRLPGLIKLLSKIESQSKNVSEDDSFRLRLNSIFAHLPPKYRQEAMQQGLFYHFNHKYPLPSQKL